MEDSIDLSFDVYEICDVVLDEPELRITKEVCDVIRASGDEIVKAYYFVPLGDEPVAEVRSDETGTAGDENAWH
jgi:hypothetical protein